MVVKLPQSSDAKKKPPVIPSVQRKAKVKTIKVSLVGAKKKPTKLGKQHNPIERTTRKVNKSKISPKKETKGLLKKITVRVKKKEAKAPPLKQKIEVTKKSTKGPSKVKSETIKHEALNAQNNKPVVSKLLNKLKKLRISSQHNLIGMKVEAIKDQKAKKQEDTKLTAKTDNPTEAYLTTPTMEMLKVFRTAAEETRRKQIQLRKSRGSGKGFLAKPAKNTKKYNIDLRVHSPATDGYFSTGGVEPAAALVRLAKAKGIDVLAITDSFSSSMLDEVKKNAAGMKITILPGLELSCHLGYCDDFQIVALFPETHTGADLEVVLDELKVPLEYRGNPNYNLKTDFKEVLKVIERQGGVVIPSHVDKTPNRQGVIAELVETYGFRCFDLVHSENTDYFKDYWPDGGFIFFSFSNANSLAQIGTRVTKTKLVSPNFDGIKQLVTRKV